MAALRARVWRRPIAGAGFAVLAGGLAACGGDGVVKEEPTPDPPTAATPVQPQPSSTTPGAAPVVDEDGGERGGESGDRAPG